MRMNLKYVEPGQPLEVAFDLYPGQIFQGKVHSISRANGGDNICRPTRSPNSTCGLIPQGQYAAKIFLDDPDQSKFPIGAHGFIRSISDYEMRAASEANDSAGWRQLRRNTGSAKMTKTSPDTSNGSARVETTVVGLFRARGQAENARNRLKTEGVSEDRIELKVLKETAPVPPATQLELDTLSTLDPFFAILGALRHEYVSYIRNGETALMVHGLTGDEVEDVARILRFFAPLRVDVIPERADSPR
jgi:hypothetical protein